MELAPAEEKVVEIRSLSQPEDVAFESISRMPGGIRLGLRTPAGFTGPMDLYSIGDLRSFPWTLETTLGTTPGSQIEVTLSTNDRIRFYRAFDAGIDGDGDGLPNARERLLYGTDSLKDDTDGDGLSDGDEVLAYDTNPLKADSDGDKISDQVEITRGTNPNLLTEEGTVGLNCWTPMRGEAE